MAEKRIQQTHKIYADFYRISGGLALVILGIWIGSLLFTDGYATNVYTEFLSVIATIVILDRINQWRDRENLKARLMNEVRSPAVGQATAALAWLRREDWIEDNTFSDKDDLLHVNWENAFVGGLNLSKSNMRYAKLRGITNLTDAIFLDAEVVDMSETDLNYSDFSDAKLSNVDFKNSEINQANFSNSEIFQSQLINVKMYKANLTGANFLKSFLQYSRLTHSNLENANFTNAWLQHTSLDHVNLENAIFSGTLFQGANLKHANINNVIWQQETYKTILPDGQKWTPETDMAKFTNPEHPDFAATLDKINAIRREMGIDPLT